MVLLTIFLDTFSLDLKMVSSTRSSFSSSITLLYIKYKYYDVFILKFILNSIGNCYPMHFPYIPIYFLLEKLLFLIFLKTSLMNLNMVINIKIELVELYNCDVHHIYILLWLHFENVN